MHYRSNNRNYVHKSGIEKRSDKELNHNNEVNIIKCEEDRRKNRVLRTH